MTTEKKLPDSRSEEVNAAAPVPEPSSWQSGARAVAIVAVINVVPRDFQYMIVGGMLAGAVLSIGPYIYARTRNKDEEGARAVSFMLLWGACFGAPGALVAGLYFMWKLSRDTPLPRNNSDATDAP